MTVASTARSATPLRRYPAASGSGTLAADPLSPCKLREGAAADQTCCFSTSDRRLIRPSSEDFGASNTLTWFLELLANSVRAAWHGDRGRCFWRKDPSPRKSAH